MANTNRRETLRALGGCVGMLCLLLGNVACRRQTPAPETGRVAPAATSAATVQTPTAHDAGHDASRAVERVFQLDDASKTYFVEVRTMCEDRSCEGHTTVTLKPKETNKPTQQTIEVDDASFPLNEQQNAPVVNDTQSYGATSFLVFDDFNFDGVEDLAINRKGGGGYANSYFDVYLGNSRGPTLQKNKAFSALSGPGSLGMFSADRERKRLVTSSKDGCCLHRTQEYAVIKQRPRRVRSEVVDQTGRCGYVVTIEDTPVDDGVTVEPLIDRDPTPGASDAGLPGNAGPQRELAFMVLAGEFATQAEAEQRLSQYKEKGLPAHDDYPRLVESSALGGAPERWLLVVALPKDEDVARGLASAIPGATVRQIRIDAPEDLHILEIGRLTIRYNDESLRPPAYRLGIGQRCPAGYPSDCSSARNGRGDIVPAHTTRMVIPFAHDPKGVAARVVSLRFDSSVWDCHSQIVFEHEPSGRRHRQDRLSIACEVVEGD